MSNIYFNFNSTIINKIARKLLGDLKEKKYYSNFFSGIEYPKPSKGKILLHAGIGHMFVTPIEMLMYHLLKVEGYDVDYIIYDEQIPINEVITKQVIQKQGKNVFWNKSVRNAKRILEASGVRFEYIEILPEVKSIVDSLKNSLEAYFTFNYEGISFGDIVKGVMYRYYKSSTFEEDATEIAKKFMVTALTNYLFIKRRINQNKYKYVLFSHGIYATWQPVVELCKKENIPYVCYDRAKTKGTMNFNLNNPSPVWDISEAWDRLKDYELAQEEKNKVHSYLQERELQKGDVYAYNFAKKSANLDELKDRLGIDGTKKIITIFTNLIWDAANVSRDIAFNSPLDCIKQTISAYALNKDVHILIRTHPAEKVLGTRERYGVLVRKLFDKLPGNVTIIEPEDNINSFSIIDISDVGVVHTSTVGLEMAIEGKPVVLISETHYRGKGFTYDASSEEHYFKLINNLLQDNSTLHNQKELAEKYFFLMMFEYQHKMPMNFTNDGVFNGYGYKTFNDLCKNKSEPVVKIITRLSGNKTFNDFIFR